MGAAMRSETIQQAGECGGLGTGVKVAAEPVTWQYGSTGKSKELGDLTINDGFIVSGADGDMRDFGPVEDLLGRGAGCGECEDRAPDADVVEQFRGDLNIAVPAGEVDQEQFGEEEMARMASALGTSSSLHSS